MAMKTGTLVYMRSVSPDVRAVISSVVGDINTFQLIGLQADGFV